MLNVACITGRLTKAPELKSTTSGKHVTSVSVACERDVKSDGERVTDFIDVVVWGTSAEYLCKYADKGSSITVDGRLQVRVWTDKDGNNRRTVEVIAEKVYVNTYKKDANAEEVPAPAEITETTEDGDLPF